MAAQTLRLCNKFGFCKYRERCRKRHENYLCEETSCDIRECRQRHPKLCKYFESHERCKFNHCKYKHENGVRNGLEDAVKVINDKMIILEAIISEKNAQIEDLSRKLSR